MYVERIITQLYGIICVISLTYLLQVLLTKRTCDVFCLFSHRCVNEILRLQFYKFISRRPFIGIPITNCQPVTPAEVAKLLSSSSSKSSCQVFISTSLIKSCSSVLYLHSCSPILLAGYLALVYQYSC